MQRDEYEIPYGRNLRAPTVATGWGVTNPRPTAFEAYGALTGEMMGQSDDLSDIAAHAPIVARICGVWTGGKHKVVPEGTVLCVKTIFNGKNGNDVTFSNDVGLMESNNGVKPNKETRTEVAKRTVLSDFPMEVSSNVRFVVLANDLMDVEPTNGDPKKIIIAAAVQSVAVVIIPPHQVLTSIYPGDALYAPRFS